MHSYKTIRVRLLAAVMNYTRGALVNVPETAALLLIQNKQAERVEEEEAALAEPSTKMLKPAPRNKRG